MWQRFQFFMTIETAIVGGNTIFAHTETTTPCLAVVGLVFAVVWHIMGAEDRVLVTIYRYQVEIIGRELARLNLTSAQPVQSSAETSQAHDSPGTNTHPGIEGLLSKATITADSYVPVGDIKETIKELYPKGGLPDDWKPEPVVHARISEWRLQTPGLAAALKMYRLRQGAAAPPDKLLKLVLPVGSVGFAA